MKVLSIIKRIAPFFLTFAVGLLIASIFVPVGAPNFQFRRGFGRHHEMDRQMRMENDLLRQENERLRNRLSELERRDWVLDDNLDVPPPPLPPARPLNTVPYQPR